MSKEIKGSKMVKYLESKALLQIGIIIFATIYFAMAVGAQGSTTTTPVKVASNSNAEDQGCAQSTAGCTLDCTSGCTLLGQAFTGTVVMSGGMVRSFSPAPGSVANIGGSSYRASQSGMNCVRGVGTSFDCSGIRGSIDINGVTFRGASSMHIASDRTVGGTMTTAGKISYFPMSAGSCFVVHTTAGGTAPQKIDVGCGGTLDMSSCTQAASKACFNIITSGNFNITVTDGTGNVKLPNGVTLTKGGVTFDLTGTPTLTAGSLANILGRGNKPIQVNVTKDTALYFDNQNHEGQFIQLTDVDAAGKKVKTLFLSGDGITADVPKGAVDVVLPDPSVGGTINIKENGNSVYTCHDDGIKKFCNQNGRTSSFSLNFECIDNQIPINGYCAYNAGSDSLGYTPEQQCAEQQTIAGHSMAFITGNSAILFVLVVGCLLAGTIILLHRGVTGRWIPEGMHLPPSLGGPAPEPAFILPATYADQDECLNSACNIDDVCYSMRCNEGCPNCINCRAECARVYPTNPE